jgi:hypothetical protein
MMRMALAMVADEVAFAGYQMVGKHEEARPLVSEWVSEWAEELAGISYRRNTMERTLRSIAINFLRVAALSTKDAQPAKAILLTALPQKRRTELEPFNLEAIADKLLWLELVAVINKNWLLFERVFGDKTLFNDNATIVNDRPDAHAKRLEPGDVAMHRRALQWLEDRLARI